MADRGTAAREQTGGTDGGAGNNVMTADQTAGSRLGRGLAALIGDVGVESPAPVGQRSGVRTLPIAFLSPNPHNPRKAFEGSDLDDLVASIRGKGVVQPILVRQVPGAENAYEIIAGERRWRAAQRAGLHDIPVVIRNVSDQEALELAIIENVQRADLNPLEEAVGYRRLLDEHQYTQTDLADVIGKSRPHVSNTLRLLKLPHEVQAFLKSGELTAGHARALVTHPDPVAAARRIVESGLSVRDTEAIAAPETRPAKPRRPRLAPAKDADTLALEKSVGDRLGLNVTIDNDGEAGQVTVRYSSLEQLDEVCRRLRTG